MRLKRLIFVLILCVVIWTYLIYPMSWHSGERQLSGYTEEDDDISMFKEQLRRDYTLSCAVSTPLMLNDIAQPENAMLVVVGVERSYNAFELQSVVDFVQRGGKLILVDDYGYGNELADALSRSVSKQFTLRFSETLVLSERFSTNKSYPIINATWGNESFELLMNIPTSLDVTGEEGCIEVIASSGEAGYIDRNYNAAIDLGEKFKVPVIVGVAVGKGYVLFISDPGMFINEVWAEAEFDNALFVRTLVSDLLPEDGVIVIDESRHANDRYLQNVYWSVGYLVLVTTDIGLSATILIITCIMVAVTFLTVKGKRDWRHRFDLSHYTPRAMTPIAIEELRATFSEKLKLKHNLSSAELHALDEAGFARFISEPMLLDLMIGRRSYTQPEIDYISELIREW